MMLDASAGNRMLWSNKNPPNTVFLDKNTLLKIPPDILGVWENLPFRDDVFDCVLFDPPHKFNRTSGFWANPSSPNYYGADISRTKLVTGIFHGTREFLRIAKRLCFKWSDDEISLARVLSLFPREWEKIFHKEVDKNNAHGNIIHYITFCRNSNNSRKESE